MIPPHVAVRWVMSLLIGLFVVGAGAAVGKEVTVAGAYTVTGTNPGGAGRYRGEVVVVQTGEVYQIGWTIGRSRHIGTGVLRGGTLSVVYQQPGQPAGIAVYRLQPDGSLSGVWTRLGGKVIGRERWVPKERA